METCGVPADALTRSLALIFGITRFLPSLPKEPAGASIHIIEVSCFVFVLFIYLFWLCWFSIAAWAFLQLWQARPTLPCNEWASHCSGFSCCRAWILQRTGFGSCGLWAHELRFPGSRAQAQQLWCMGLVALWQVGSPRIGNQTRVSCTGRQILYH